VENVADLLCKLNLKQRGAMPFVVDDDRIHRMDCMIQFTPFLSKKYLIPSNLHLGTRTSF
jgi:hypothetical protein